MKEIIINHFFYYEFVYVFFLFSIMFLLISVFVKQQIIRKILILSFSIFFILLVFEFILSFSMEKIEPDYIPEFFYSDLGDKQINKDHDIKIKSRIDGKFIMTQIDDYDNRIYEKVYDVIYSKYNNGLRYTKRNENSTEAYIFLGCSFTFGHGLNDDETLPYFFSQLFDFNVNVINCAVLGKSTNNALNILNNEIFIPLLNENLSIKSFFYSLMFDHIYRNFRILCNDASDSYIMLKDKKYTITNKIVKFKYLFARSYIFRKVFIPIIDEYFEQYYEDYMIESLKEMNRIVKEKYNSKLTIIIWPDEKYDKIFIEKLKETNLDLIFLPEYLIDEEKYAIKYDGHPTAKANKEIAEILYNHINKSDNLDKEKNKEN